MTTYEIMKFYEGLIKTLDKLNPFIEKIKNTQKKIESFDNQIILKISSTNIKNEMNALVQLKNNIVNELTKYCININPLAFNDCLKDIEYELKDKKVNEMSNENEILNDLLNGFRNNTEVSFEYLHSKNNPNLIKLKDSIKTIFYNYENIVETYNKSKTFYEMTRDNKKVSSEEFLCFYFPDKITHKSFIYKIALIYSLHSEFCKLLNIEENLEEIIKIESGSLLEQFKANKDVINAIILFFTSIFNFCNKEKKKKEKISIDKLFKFIKEKTELVKQLDEIGVNTEFAKKEIEESYKKLILIANVLLLNNTEFSINDNKFEIDSSYKETIENNFNLDKIEGLSKNIKDIMN